MKTGLNCILLTLVMVLTVDGLFAQKKKSSSNKGKPGNVIYSIESNDPVNAPNLSFSLFPLYADIYTLNINLGYGIEGNYRLNNKVEFNGFYRGSYIDRFRKSTGNVGMSHGFSDDEDKGVRSFGFSGMFYFKEDLRVINEDVKIKQHSDGHTRTIYYIEVPARRLTLFGLRAGYESFSSSVFSENNNILYSGAPAGNYTSPYLPDFSTGRYSNYINSGYLSIGFCRTRISDLHIATEKHGKKSSASVTQLYFDVLYSTGYAYSTMNVALRDSASQQFNVYHPFNVDAPWSKIGIRAGFSEHVNMKFHVLGSFGVEAGMRPGPTSGFDRFYLMLKFGLNFSTHVGSSSKDVDLELEE